MNNKIKKTINENEKSETERLLVEDVLKDFRKRQQERKPFESQWQLNMNFFMGNQYCSISENGEVEEFSKQFFWQEREVFNHIAPLVEVRLSKLARVRPQMAVVPASGDENDVKTAKVCKKILSFVGSNIKISNLIQEATKWSEVCGTSFYKIVWNKEKGNLFAKTSEGKNINYGDVDAIVCPPFEIFPESSTSASIDSCTSLIHARAYPVETIKDIWDVEIKGEELNVFSLDNTQSIGGLGYNASAKKITESTRSNYALVIERYERPSAEYPNGRLVIIAGEKLLYCGDLPFINGKNGEREFPFIRQISLEQTGSFWGSSIIERVIPIQRSYNAVKNRKHEFLNRIAMGVLTVEDGSVDINNLEEEGLSPGKILVYRQGSTPPSFLAGGRVPTDFTLEEERLLNEFLIISGVSELMRNSSIISENTSGVALQLMIEQDDSRLSCSADSIKDSIKRLGEHILRLYKQYASIPRIAKVSGDNNEIEMFFFSKSDISSDDIIFETDSELSETLAQKRNMVMDLLRNGLLFDENGRLSNRMRVKVLELLGFGLWENSHDINELQIKKASNENLKMIENENKVNPLEIDDHKLHINEHTAFMLGAEFENNLVKDDSLTERFLKHIRKHKLMANLTFEADNQNTEIGE